MILSPVDLLRFLDRIDEPDEQGCERWRGYVDPRRGGQFRVERRTFLAHQVAWCLAGREIPSGMRVAQTCLHVECVAEEHLYLTRQRYPGRDLTHCKRGHEFNGVNTIIRTNGRRKCRRCR